MGSKYGHLSLNWFEDLVNRLGGEAMADDFKRGTHPLQMKAPDLHFRVRVDNVPFAERIAALKRPCYVDEELVKTLQQSEQGEVELVFVPGLNRQSLGLKDNPAFMRERGLRFADPFVLMAWNAMHPEFSHHCRNLTQWRQSGSDGLPAVAMFGKTYLRDEAAFELRYQQHRTWGPEWWFAGTPIN